MSGLEVAGLVFGVLPVVIVILQSATERLRILKQHSKTVRIIELRLRAEEAKFGNECRHLLRLVIHEEKELHDMLENPEHAQWKNRELCRQFEKCLGRDYDFFEEAVIGIKELLNELQAKLSCFDSAIANRQDAREESRLETARRIQEAIKFSFRASQYDRMIAELEMMNSCLSTLREHVCPVERQQRTSISSTTRTPISKPYQAIQQASQNLHESLKDTWCCTNALHTGHQAKLLLDAKVKDGVGVHLDMAISCCLKDPNYVPESAVLEPPIWLYVQSITDSAAPPADSRPTLFQGIVGTALQGEQASAICLGLPRDKRQLETVKINLTRPFKRQRKVRFLKDAEEDARKTTPLQEVDLPRDKTPSIGPALFDLRQAQSICCHLKRAVASSDQKCSNACLGYLETPDLFKLMFYDAGARANARYRTQSMPNKETVPLIEAVHILSPLDRMRLAHKLVTAVLQYHSTPWLMQDWHLKDLSFFGQQQGLYLLRQDLSLFSDRQQGLDSLRQDLRTLHLSVQFPKSSRAPTQDIEGIESNALTPFLSTMQDIQLHYGISNMTLASLGIALLELGYQKQVQGLRAPRDTHEVITARRLLAGAHTSLGAKYHDIARKCIQCDFAFGADLSKPELQSAVYSDVLRPLEGMIEGLRALDLDA